MGEKNDPEKSVDELMLPGFRFHPTDEELVGFYLRMKLQQKPLPIELIKQLDIYKHDPWDLPKLSSTGEKEFYFYCPRDRKYRNSTRPNRVTGSGFWKATGTDRPIYSSDGAKCIGLKKSLVFYRGRASRGIKTDWMMHEFRLPSISDGARFPGPPKKIMDQNLPLNESWTICRIFKRINPMANRAISWACSLGEITLPNAQTTAENGFQVTNFSALNNPSHKDIALVTDKPSAFAPDNVPGNLVYSLPEEASVDHTCMLFNQSHELLDCKTCDSIDFQGPHEQLSGYYSANREDHAQIGSCRNTQSTTNVVHDQWGSSTSTGYPFSVPDSWKPTDLPWDSSPNRHSEISSNTYCTNKSIT